MAGTSYGASIYGGGLYGGLLYTFTPPTVDDGLETTHPLFRRYKLRRGVSVLVQGSTVTAVQYPDQQSLGNYDHVYLGGHIYPISGAERDVLTAAGYGAYIT